MYKLHELKGPGKMLDVGNGDRSIKQSIGIWTLDGQQAKDGAAWWSDRQNGKGQQQCESCQVIPLGWGP
jgi:hypothetical protein